MSGEGEKCDTCATIGDKVLAEMCKELGPECKELEDKFRRGEISPGELIDSLKDRFDPDQVAALVTSISQKNR